MNKDIELAAAVLARGLGTSTELLTALHRAWTSSDVSLEDALVASGIVTPAELAGMHDGDVVRAAVDTFLPAAGRRYVTERPLGQGGMGVVVQVKDRALGRSVALKHLSPSSSMNDEAVGTLLTEARIAGMLEHPNIMPIYDVGALPSGEPYYTMRLMDTLSLADILGLLRDGNPEAAREFPFVRRMRIFLQICYAVDYAHGRGVIHRDIKPDNVRVGRHGEAQLCDWGLARADGLPDLPLRSAVEAALARGETSPCVVIGSPNYMSPEQAMGKNDDVGVWSDVYGLGALLYEVLTLVAPVYGVDTAEIFQKVERGEIRHPLERAPDRRIPPELAHLAMTCLELRREDRPPDVRVLCRTIEAWVDGSRDRERAAERAHLETERGNRHAAQYLRLREGRRWNQDRRNPDRRDRSTEHARESDTRALEHEIAAAFFQAHDAYTRALGFQPRDGAARAKLAELALAHLEDAETREDELACQFAFLLLRRNNDGAFDAVVEGSSRLEVQTTPTGASVLLRGLTTDGQFGTAPRGIGQAPVIVNDLDAGLYLLTVEHPSLGRTSRPLFVRAGATRAVRVDLMR